MLLGKKKLNFTIFLLEAVVVIWCFFQKYLINREIQKEKNLEFSKEKELQLKNFSATHKINLYIINTTKFCNYFIQFEN